MSSQTNENKGVVGTILSPFERIAEKSVLLRKVGYKIARPKTEVLQPTSDGQQYSLTTFRVKYGGTQELKGTRTVSQEEAQKIIDKARKQGRMIENNDGKMTKGGKELSEKEIEQINIATQQVIANKGGKSGILDAFTTLSKSGKKLRVLRPIGDGKKWLETTFNIKDDGTPELEGSRTISQAEAKEILDKARKEGRLIERNKAGKFTMGGQELSEKETEMMNSAIKQTDEIYNNLNDGKSPEKNKDGQTVSGSKEPSTQPAEPSKTAAQNGNTSPLNNSLDRVNKIISTQNTVNNVKTQTPKVSKIV
jgi:(2Fe-2S) ferredoxin